MRSCKFIWPQFVWLLRLATSNVDNSLRVGFTNTIHTPTDDHAVLIAPCFTAL